MNKKSHIILSDYLSSSLDSSLYKHCFRFGNLLPDLLLYTFLRRHIFPTRSEEVLRIIQKLEASSPSPLFFVRLGCVIHYAADFFTAPHNTKARVPLKKHFEYEDFLCKKLKGFCRLNPPKPNFQDDIFKYLCTLHREYKKQPFSAENDCRFILHVCSTIYFSLIKPMS